MKPNNNNNTKELLRTTPTLTDILSKTNTYKTPITNKQDLTESNCKNRSENM